MLRNFLSVRVDLGRGPLRLYVGGRGTTLFLLHGALQSAVAWHRVAPDFAKHFSVIVPDLRGCGDSVAEAGDEADFSAEALAGDIVGLADRMGLRRFAVLGHGLGTRVALRLAMDHPDRLSRMGLIEGLPATDLWTGLTGEAAMAGFHRLLLAQPAPLPERMIGADPDGFIDSILKAGTGSGSLFAFDGRALSHYRAQLRDPRRLAAACAMYRAARSHDAQRETADLRGGRRSAVQTMLLTGAESARLPGDAAARWGRWLSALTASSVPGGHYLPEESPEAVRDTFVPFFSSSAAFSQAAA